MNDILLGQVLRNLNEAAMELHSQIKTDNEQQKLKAKSKQDKQAIVERNHEYIKALSNKEILRKPLCSISYCLAHSLVFSNVSRYNSISSIRDKSFVSWFIRYNNAMFSVVWLIKTSPFF